MNTRAPIIRAAGEGDKQSFLGGGLHTWKLLAEDTDGAFFLFEDIDGAGQDHAAASPSRGRRDRLRPRRRDPRHVDGKQTRSVRAACRSCRGAWRTRSSWSRRRPGCSRCRRPASARRSTVAPANRDRRHAPTRSTSPASKPRRPTTPRHRASRPAAVVRDRQRRLAPPPDLRPSRPSSTALSSWKRPSTSARPRLSRPTSPSRRPMSTPSCAGGCSSWASSTLARGTAAGSARRWRCF